MSVNLLLKYFKEVPKNILNKETRKNKRNLNHPFPKVSKKWKHESQVSLQINQSLLVFRRGNFAGRNHSQPGISRTLRSAD